PAATALRSAPAQKFPPSPHSTATAASGSASKARKASASAEAVAASTALRTCGRLRMIVVTASFFSVRTVSVVMSSLESTYEFTTRGAGRAPPSAAVQTLEGGGGAGKAERCA